MSVYIEALAIQDLILIFLIGATSYRFLCLRKSWIRLLSASMLGCILAIFYPLFSFPAAVCYLLRFSFGFVLSAVLFVGKTKYPKGVVTFFSVAFLYGGCVLCVGFLRYRNIWEAFSKPLSWNFWIVVASAVILFYVIKEMSVLYRRRLDLHSLILPYKLVLSGNCEIEGQGFIDTGNRLYDNVTGLPVIVIGIKTLMPYLNDEEFSLIFTGHVDKIFKNARKMTCKSVGGDSEMWLIEPEQFEVYSKTGKNILYEAVIGLSFSSLSGEENYNAILPPAISEVY